MRFIQYVFAPVVSSIHGFPGWFMMKVIFNFCFAIFLSRQGWGFQVVL